MVERDAACETCDGSGALPGSPATPCAGCGGSGRLRRTQGALVIEQMCLDCDGIGRTGMRCPACSGRGTSHKAEDIEVTVPAGAAGGQVLRMQGKGDAIRNGAPGHLYVVLHERRHPHLERRGNDLHVEVAIPPGATHVRIPLLRGGEHEVALPGDETTLVLRGQGVPILGAPPTPPPPLAAPGETSPYRELDTSGRGDLIVHLRVTKENRLKTWMKRVLG